MSNTMSNTDKKSELAKKELELLGTKKAVEYIIKMLDNTDYEHISKLPLNSGLEMDHLNDALHSDLDDTNLKLKEIKLELDDLDNNS